MIKTGKATVKIKNSLIDVYFQTDCHLDDANDDYDTICYSDIQIDRCLVSKQNKFHIASERLSIEIEETIRMALQNSLTSTVSINWLD